MKLKYLFNLLCIFSMTATGVSSSFAEGGSGVVGGGGTEINVKSLLPDEVEQRADFRWPEQVFAAHKIASGIAKPRYAQELQIRMTFRKSEMHLPNLGIHYSFFGRINRGQGEWIKLSHIQRVTPLTLVQLWKQKKLDHRQVSYWKLELNSSISRFPRIYSDGSSRFFALHFHPGFQAKFDRDYDAQAVTLSSADQSNFYETYHKPGVFHRIHWGDRDYRPRKVALFINGKSAHPSALAELNKQVNSFIIRQVDIEKPETLSPYKVWITVAKALAIENPSYAFESSILPRVTDKVTLLAQRLLDVVSADGATCDVAVLSAINNEIESWPLNDSDYFIQVGQFDLAVSGIVTDSVQSFQSTLKSISEIVNSYCVGSAIDGGDVAAKSLLFEQITEQKNALKLGDLLLGATESK